MNVLGAAALAANYEVWPAIVAGLIGGIAFLIVVSVGREVGMTQMDFLHMLGSMAAPRASRGVVQVIGLGVHLMMSVLFGLVYAGLLTVTDASNVAVAVVWGLLFGLVHGLVVLVVLPVALSMAHPLVRSGALERPGVAMVGYGSMTPAGSVMAHIAFGAVTAAIYAASVL